MPKLNHPADVWTRDVIDNAVEWTAFMQAGRVTHRCDSRAAAEAAAQELADQRSRPAIVYAIDAGGRSAFVDTFQPRKEHAVTKPSAEPKNQRRAKAAEAADIAPTTAASAVVADKPVGKRTAALEAAQRGEIPEAPDFSADTHKRFRKKLAEIVALVEAGDIAGLKVMPINPVSSSPKAMDRYRNLAVIAMEARSLCAV